MDNVRLEVAAIIMSRQRGLCSTDSDVNWASQIALRAADALIAEEARTRKAVCRHEVMRDDPSRHGELYCKLCGHDDPVNDSIRQQIENGELKQ